MVRNKPRLQAAVYVRLKHPNSYHWAFFVKPGSPTRRHRDIKYYVRTPSAPSTRGPSEIRVPLRL
ncbi:hypothetical protein GQ43DRAFT_440101 [Delitschia confertaspora ATCC 74209]|uniref:Uncharacterized protein n=1 Tax=Delitschia confertaspora ATCC 74209 TaxID=1513339 RepID=A0A9P4JRM7_9PLEO|nr:hypothetical protein GQ43DRAFT_440101 [Delitschia confertaspora ATCC 74209]